jgi:hypothetical protein
MSNFDYNKIINDPAFSSIVRFVAYELSQSNLSLYQFINLLSKDDLHLIVEFAGNDDDYSLVNVVALVALLYESEMNEMFSDEKSFENAVKFFIQFVCAYLDPDKSILWDKVSFDRADDEEVWMI